MNSEPDPRLKPCPFCGGEARIGGREYSINDAISCRSCGAQTVGVNGVQAETRWNTRMKTQTATPPNKGAVVGVVEHKGRLVVACDNAVYQLVDEALVVINFKEN